MQRRVAMSHTRDSQERPLPPKKCAITLPRDSVDVNEGRLIGSRQGSFFGCSAAYYDRLAATAHFSEPERRDHVRLSISRYSNWVS
jgi:hypothetical protein